MSDATYIFRWDRHGRKGQRCVILASGTMNSCLIRFEDGYMMVTSRNALGIKVPFNSTVRPRPFPPRSLSQNAASRFATANCRSCCRSHG
jgi:hypothetical protein